MSEGRATNGPQYSQLQVTICGAKLRSVGGVFSSKADPYLELSVDGQPPRKTEVSKKTWSPSWNEHFTVLVTPYSKLQFRVMNHFQLKADVLLGESTLDLYTLLQRHNGKFDATSHKLDLKADVKGTPQATGDLNVTLTGMNINMENYPSRGTPNGLPRTGATTSSSSRNSSRTSGSSNTNSSSNRNNPSSSQNSSRPPPPPPTATLR